MTAPCPALSGTAVASVVALGTSLTARGGWTDALAAGLAGTANLHIVARPGAGTRWALASIAAIRALRPRLVLIELGANDAALHRGITLRESRRGLARLLAALPDADRLVMAMNPAHGLRGLLRPRLDRYADAHLEAALDAGASVLDARPGWRALSPAERRVAIPDGLHPRPEAVAAILTPLIFRHPLVVALRR